AHQAVIVDQRFELAGGDQAPEDAFTPRALAEFAELHERIHHRPCMRFLSGGKHMPTSVSCPFARHPCRRGISLISLVRPLGGSFTEGGNPMGEVDEAAAPAR